MHIKQLTAPSSMAPTPGTIIGAVDSGIFEATTGNTPSIVHVFGDVYAIAYQGPGGDGWVCTISVDNVGNIGAVLDTLEFDAADGHAPCIIHVTGDIFAIAYFQDILNDGIVRTVTIDNAGNIGAATIDTLTFDAVRGRAPNIIHITGDVYAIAYNGAGDRGLLCTFTIDNAGNIGGATIASFAFDLAAGSGRSPHIIHISDDVYAIVYTDAAEEGVVITVTIDNAGNIGGAILDSLTYDTTWSNSQHIVHVTGDIYAVAYTVFIGGRNIGTVTTFAIDNAGNIGATTLGTFIFDAVQGIRSDIIHISGTTFAIPYQGPDADGWICTISIDAAGNIGATTIDTFEFDTVAADYPDIIHVFGTIYAIAYTHAAGTSPGHITTIQIK